jgi:alpha-ribazole phosphatase
MRLLIVRHGATANNLQARYTGQSDVPLSALGERQAAALAERLHDERLDAIVTSDLQRARSTAEAVTAYHDAPLVEDAALREIAMGAWEGLTHAEVQARFPQECAAWEGDPLHNAPLGGETVSAFAERVEHALRHWYERYPGGSVLWVTHGGLIGVLLCQLLGMSLDRRWQFRRDNAALNELEIGADWAVVTRLNGAEHLQDLDERGEQERVQVL